MGKRAARVMASQAHNLRHALHKVCCGDSQGGLLLVEKVAEALEEAAKAERQAGKRWWEEQEAERKARQQREMAEVDAMLIKSRQERWL